MMAEAPANSTSLFVPNERPCGTGRVGGLRGTPLGSGRPATTGPPSPRDVVATATAPAPPRDVAATAAATGGRDVPRLRPEPGPGFPALRRESPIDSGRPTGVWAGHAQPAGHGADA
jgi:hypothetical protein